MRIVDDPIYPRTWESLRRGNHRKKNQGKGEAEGKQKAKGDDVVREMYRVIPVLEQSMY